jgi:hypothetical protein
MLIERGSRLFGSGSGVATIATIANRRLRTNGKFA